MGKVRYGVVGVGNMGRGHCDNCAGACGKSVSLGAVCDIIAERAAEAGERYGVPHFTDAQAMYDSHLVDAAVIATPHYWHAPLAIRAARAGLHVLCEKPLASTVGAARAMIAECRKRKVALGVVLHHRARPVMMRMKQLVAGGRIGEVFRVQLICSSWFRTQAYYDSGAWRGTWDGEGGGVLINQAPHHLDLFQWIGGMPRRVIGLLHTRAHEIEVEDTANFLFEYPEKGKVGYLYATTAEEPGIEQFVVSGDKGTLVAQRGGLRLGKLKIPIHKHIMTSKRSSAGGAEQETTWQDVKVRERKGSLHGEVARAFAAHVLTGSPMYIDGDEALKELELSNAMYIAGYKGKPVDLPVDAAEMERLMTDLERRYSTGKGQGIRRAASADLKRLLSAKK